jgi:hypothetical protein
MAMTRFTTSILAVALVLAPTAGLPARPRQATPGPMAADLAYQPAPPTAALALREASWRLLSFRTLDGHGLAWRGLQLIGEPAQKRYLQNAQAAQALELLQHCDEAKRRANTWIVAAPSAGAVLGLVAGVAIGNQETSNSIANFEDKVAGGVVGLVAGVVAGTAVGLPMRLHEQKQAKALQAKALDSFNRKLFDDLRLTVEPTQGGGAVGVGAKF